MVASPHKGVIENESTANVLSYVGSGIISHVIEGVLG
jgi:hypothetical protein